MELQQISLSDYDYQLPEDRIAKYPRKERSDSNLLVYNNTIEHSKFHQLGRFLPGNSTLVFNNTQVIPARLYLKKDTGSTIEIFLTESLLPHTDFQKASQSKSPVVWKCIVGNKKKWKEGQTLSFSHEGLSLTARWYDQTQNDVELSWEGDFLFHEVLEKLGNMPLPPYMKREAESIDKHRYQTVYGRNKGAVAAPTAGLHFTEVMLNNLSQEHNMVEVTLHVSAGTFKPISSSKVLEHEMHNELIQVKRSAIESMIEADHLVLTGTTTLRTLESLFWFGVKISQGENDFHIEKLYPYQHSGRMIPDRREALELVLKHMDQLETDSLTGSTELLIVPGYDFRMTDALITNFHLPGSTLILLVAALVGSDWKKIYSEALTKDYNFLSYGDSSLLFRNKSL